MRLHILVLSVVLSALTLTALAPSVSQAVMVSYSQKGSDSSIYNMSHTADFYVYNNTPNTTLTLDTKNFSHTGWVSTQAGPMSIIADTAMNVWDSDKNKGTLYVTVKNSNGTSNTFSIVASTDSDGTWYTLQTASDTSWKLDGSTSANGAVAIKPYSSIGYTGVGDGRIEQMWNDSYIVSFFCIRGDDNVNALTNSKVIIAVNPMTSVPYNKAVNSTNGVNCMLGNGYEEYWNNKCWPPVTK